MLTAGDLLETLRRGGAWVTRSGQSLVVEAPRGVLGADVQAALLALKPQLLDLLSDGGVPESPGSLLQHTGAGVRNVPDQLGGMLMAPAVSTLGATCLGVTTAVGLDAPPPVTTAAPEGPSTVDLADLVADLSDRDVWLEVRDRQLRVHGYGRLPPHYRVLVRAWAEALACHLGEPAPSAGAGTSPSVRRHAPPPGVVEDGPSPRRDTDGFGGEWGRDE